MSFLRLIRQTSSAWPEFSFDSKPKSRGPKISLRMSFPTHWILRA